MRKRVFALVLVAILLLLPAQGVLAAQQPVLDVDHIIIVPDQNGFRIQEILTINNPDSKEFTGGTITDPTGKAKKGWVFPLLVGFQNPQLQGENLSQADYAVAKEGIQVYKPLAPGKTEFSLVYTVPGNKLPTSLTKKVVFETKELFAVTPQESLSVKSDLLKPQEAFEIKGKIYQQYYGQNIKAGADVTLTLEQGQPAQQNTASAGNKVAAGYRAKLHPDAHMKLFTSEPLVYTNPHIWAAYLIIMVVLGIAALILLYKRRANREDAVLEEAEAEADLDEDDEEFLRLNAKQEMLLQKINDLDAALKSGEIEVEEHRETREKLKQMLVRVKMQLRELT